MKRKGVDFVGLYTIGSTFFLNYFKLFNRVEIIGQENVPKEGGVMLCCNHIDNMDPPLLGSTCSRDVHFMAKAEIFDVPVLGYLVKNVKAFPIKRGMADKKALRTGITLLNEGNVIGVFPEGTRSKTGKLGKGLAGAGYFALKSNAAIVPCAIVGSYNLFNKQTIIFGKPIDFTTYKEEKISAQDAVDKIMNEIQKLIDSRKNRLMA
jgi:1-acyl-sn-glycerol-3-phosphate acyltransferase